MSQVGDHSKEALVEISLGDAHYKDDSEIVPKKINHKYMQKNSVKGILRGFLLFDDIYLYYSLKKSRAKQALKHRIDLTYLDPKPRRAFYLAWRWLLWGVVAITAAVLSIYIGEFSGLSVAHPLMLPVGILLGTFGFVFILLSYYKSYNNVVYRSYAGRVPLMVLSHKPGKKDYKEFIKVIEEGIHKAQRRNGITLKDRLVGEMKDIRRFRDAGIISEKDYHEAQGKIFRHESYSS